MSGVSITHPYAECDAALAASLYIMIELHDDRFKNSLHVI